MSVRLSLVVYFKAFNSYLEGSIGYTRGFYLLDRVKPKAKSRGTSRGTCGGGFMGELV